MTEKIRQLDTNTYVADDKRTLALIPIGKKKTVIYEDHECFIVDEKILKIMDSNCKYYGSSISGRIQGTYSLTGFNYKAPIIVEEDKSIIFFPIGINASVFLLIS